MKLKPIPDNTVVHTPTEAEAKELLAILHENGYQWRLYRSPMYDTKWDGYYSDTVYFIRHEDKTISVGYKSDLSTLTLAEFKERFLTKEEKSQPKFKVDDIVAIRWINKSGTITDMHYDEDAEEWEYNIKVNPKGLATALERNIFPYTEPETKPTEYMEAKEKESREKGNNSENSQLNFLEIFKGCEGETVYSLIDGVGKVTDLNEDGFLVNHWYFRNDGSLSGYDSPTAKCLVYPSRVLYEQYPLDAKKAWEVWQEEQEKYILQICYATLLPNNILMQTQQIRLVNLKFQTEVDRDKAIGEIKAIIEKYRKQ